VPDAGDHASGSPGPIPGGRDVFVAGAAAARIVFVRIAVAAAWRCLRRGLCLTAAWKVRDTAAAGAGAGSGGRDLPGLARSQGWTG